jgi:hypothetical protein
MLADALFSPAQQKLLALLFIRADEAFHLNEIIGITGLSNASVQRELRRLHEAMLVGSRRVGNVREFRCNKESAVYPELHGLIQKTFGSTGVLLAALTPLMPELRVAFVYGSIAKGSETAVSDVELLLVGDSIGHRTLLSALGPAEQALGRKISATRYSLADFRKRQHEQQHILMRILEQPKIFIVGDEHVLALLGELHQDTQAKPGKPENTLP